MRILVARNHDETDLGVIAPALAERGAHIDVRHLDAGGTLPATAADHDGLVVLGGVQNALDDEGSPYFQHLLALIRDFAERDRAVMGVCLGSQLVARAFGGRNIIGGASEFGWCDVAATPRGRSDPLFASMPEQFPIFQWHDDTFTLPPGAERLATAGSVPNQAFRIGGRVYGCQFHFEADCATVREWVNASGAMIAERHPDWDLEADIARHGRAADDAGLAIARAWAAVV